MLQQVGKLLGETVRSRDILARLGGDEFAIILEHCTVDQANGVAQNICDRMDDFRFVHDERCLRVGTSVGLVPIDTRWASTCG
jgi:diguanylate cyclase (GGDEF)-like protein